MPTNIFKMFSLHVK